MQLIPGGVGSAFDVLLVGKANAINQKRFTELVSNVQTLLDRADATDLNNEFLNSEECFEIFRASAEIAARSADAKKREIVAHYLSGIIRAGVITDLSSQVLEDLRFLQPIHLQVLAALPITANEGVDKQHPPKAIENMPLNVYEKAISDLERFGFIRYNTTGIGTFGGGSGHWETTEYVRTFREHIANVSS